MIDQELQRLFAEFERAIGAHDFETMGDLYADSFMSAGPTGSAMRTRAELLTQAHAASVARRGAMSCLCIVSPPFRFVQKKKG